MKTAFVTGSTRGIGRGIADLLSENGYTVIYSGTRGERPADLPCEKDYVGCNIANGDERKQAIEYIIKKYGRLDVLVNNAGVAPLERKNVLEMSEESYDRVLDINLKGTFFMCQLAANAMLDGQKSLADYTPRIINIGSISAYTVSIARGEYCISKAGLTMATMLFADALSDNDIPVFEVRPGIIDTDMTKVVHEKYENLIAGGLTPIKRFGKPKDVAQMVLACASGLLDFACGQVLNADGGFHIRRL